MRQLDMALCEEAHRDCESDPGSFASYNEAFAVLKLHDGHGPTCRPHLAASAFVAATHD
ncbi:hypothetical protein [Nocardia salmonicida]|uniref:hypothetical protein n=1 Tax=Nocardia salmonicida TaxID=53431 RepID=UPI000A6D6BBA|nr:hypothetical protein [Nocardia salmonicida]